MSHPPTHWTISPERSLALDRPRLIAIVNVTPDSFADGGRFASAGAVADYAAQALADGADMLDIGGESTRPGASRVTAPDQITRVVPAINAIRTAGLTLPISVDTTLSEVAAAALDAGANAINDVSAGLEDPAMLDLAADRRCGIILMHRLRPPGDDSFSDQYDHPPQYPDVVAAVRGFLAGRLAAACAAGIDPAAVVLDPGLGFGKSVEQNLELIRRTPELLELGCPILSAASRKSFVGRIALDRDSDPSERLPASLAVSTTHLGLGARLFRVHDVAPQAAALRAAWQFVHPHLKDTPNPEFPPARLGE